jgi:hypothetical protein
LAPEEEQGARRHALQLVEETDFLGFRQPCVAHRGNQCAIYADRPAACAGYRCETLRRHDANEIERGEALLIIAQARTLVGNLAKLLGIDAHDGVHHANVWDALEARVVDTPEWRRAHRALLLQSVALATFLRRHFHAGFRRDTRT